MSTNPDIRVLHFDRSAVQAEAVHETVHAIYREWRAGCRVLGTCPATADGPTSDDLLQRAEQLGLPPQPGSPAAHLAAALDRSGLPFRFADPTQTVFLKERGVVILPAVESAS